jgi:hypothetical protein
MPNTVINVMVLQFGPHNDTTIGIAFLLLL